MIKLSNRNIATGLEDCTIKIWGPNLKYGEIDKIEVCKSAINNVLSMKNGMILFRRKSN